MSTSIVNDAKTIAKLWAEHHSDEKYSKSTITLGQLRELVNAKLSHLGDDVALASLKVPEHIIEPGPHRPARIDFVFMEI